MGWKYIMAEITMPQGLKVKVPIIFPDKLIHLEVATVIKLVAPLDGNKPQIVSAGTIEHIVPVGLGGESDTLKLKSRESDALTIKQYSYFHGVNCDG
jgi:hypothetical protein